MKPLMFSKSHGIDINIDSFNVDVDDNKMREVCTRVLGGGAAQSFTALKILEHYIAYEKPEYVVEIGSQKGGLSVYIGTIACVTEQFIFHTFEIDKNRDWYNRQAEGAGHWFEKMESVSPYCKSFERNIFTQDTYDFINSYVSQYKTLIICDGGDKPREMSMYSGMLKSGDMIMSHDFGNEITDRDINFDILSEHQPFCSRFFDNKTLFKAFIRK